MVNKWLIHVNEYRKNNPNVTYKNALINAKLTYRQKKGNGLNDNEDDKDKPQISVVGKYAKFIIPISLAILSGLIASRQQKRTSFNGSASLAPIKQKNANFKYPVIQIQQNNKTPVGVSMTQSEWMNVARRNEIINAS
tara:strand:+ start:473 stop:886 length:414 start_codon:yes stop_codon:yes gene_type:complete